eukprot:m.9824 g.9824  ORF g.9824 m.9824 type:complete len:78 (+) comp6434_c0_seq1:443-676(+)
MFISGYLWLWLFACLQVQDLVSEEFKDERAWAKKCIINVANGGFFSSDRTIQQYATQIWNAKPVHVESEGAKADEKK